MKQISDSERQALKERTTKIFDRFTEYQAVLLDKHPELLERLNVFVDSSNKCQHVSHKLKHLIWIAVDSVCTHLYDRGVRIHALFAWRDGATEAEVLEAIAIATRLNLATYENGIGIILEETAAEGDAAPEPLEQNHGEEFARGLASLGDELWVQQSLRHSRHAFPAKVALCTPPVSVLDEKSAALIALSVEACPAVLNQAGIRRQARRAVQLGATREELVEVLELAAGIGMHGLSVGVPIIQKASEEFAITGGKQ